MPRRKQGHFSQSECVGEELTYCKSSSLRNGMADESQSDNVQEIQSDDPPPVNTLVEVVSSLTSGRRRRTGVVSMGPQPTLQSIAENISNPSSCSSCKALVKLCRCDPKHLPRVSESVGELSHFGTPTSNVFVSTMAGPLAGQSASSNCPSRPVSNEAELRIVSECNDSQSLVGRGPIVSSLPWQAVKREDPSGSTIFLDKPSRSSADRHLSISSSVSNIMLSSIYGVKPSNIETVLSGLVLDKPKSLDTLTIDCNLASGNGTLSPSSNTLDVDTPRTRCHSLPSSTFSLSNIISNQDSISSRGDFKLSTSVAVSQSSSIQTLSGYSISRTSKLTRPEVIEQHISKIISENAAIVETQDPLWVKRYMRQSSLAIESNSDDEAKKLKTDGKVRRFSEEVTSKFKSGQSSKFKSKLHSALLGKLDEVSYPYEAPNGRKMSFDSRVKNKSSEQPQTRVLFRGSEKTAWNSKFNSFKSSEVLPADGEKHPQNPEGSIIKDLLLNSLHLPVRKSPVSGDDDSQNSGGPINGDNATRHVNFQNLTGSVHYCLVCNIGFRSKENLDAHKSHYCKGGSESTSSLLEVPGNADWKSQGPVNKRSSSFSYPRPLPCYATPEFGSGQILKQQLLSSSPKKRKISEPVFSLKPSDGIFGYPGVLKHGRSSFCGPPLLEETGFPSSSTTTPVSFRSHSQEAKTQETTTSVSVVVTMSKPIFNSGATIVHYTSLETRTASPSITTTSSMMQNSSSSGSVIVSPQAAISASEPTESVFFSTIDRPTCLNQPNLNQTSQDKRPKNISTDAKADNLKNVQLVKDDSSIAQSPKLIVPTVILSPCSPLAAEDPPATEEEKNPKKFLVAKTHQVASRPTSLPLSKKAVTLVGSTIVSPETPRPKRNVIELYINGQVFTTLGFKCSTRSSYCCIYLLQPMYVPQDTEPGLSMYSNWQTHPHQESVFGLTPGQEISLYNTKNGQRSSLLSYASSTISNTLVVTHSSYWQFRKQEVDSNQSASEKWKLTDTPSDEKSGESNLSSETSCGQIGMESDSIEEGKSVVGQECLSGIVRPKKSFDNSSTENNESIKIEDESLSGSSLNRKYSEEFGDVSTSQVTGEPGQAPTATKSPKRVRIFQGGFRSNEDYTYIRGRGRGKYVCEECGIRCKKPSMLKKHIRTHTDLRPYKCSHCAFAFKTKGNLTKHMKSKAHHKKCLELGIVPVPTTIDESQIDELALSKQFSDADDEDDDDDLDEDEEESEYEEDDDDSQDHRDEEEICSSEKDLDGVTRDSEQFEDAEANIPVTSAAAVLFNPLISEDVPVSEAGPLLTLPLDSDIAWDQEREAARSLLNLSSCGLNRINNCTSDWVMASPVSQIHKSEGSVGSMESLSSAAGCILSGSEVSEEINSENLGGIPRSHWSTIPELSPKSRKRSYSVNMPPARSGNTNEIQLANEGTANREHLQTRVISFASSLPVVLEDQMETTTARRYSMSAIGEPRNTCGDTNIPSTSNNYERNMVNESGASVMNIQDGESDKGSEVCMPKSWVSVNGEQPMDLRVTKEPRENMAHLNLLSLSSHLWKSNSSVGESSSTMTMNDGKSYEVLASPGSDLAMMSPERNNCGMSDYVYSGISSNRLSAGNAYFPTSDGEDMAVSKMPYELHENLEVDGSVDMLEASYSSEADDYQHPLSPVSQNSMDNDSQCNHIEDVCGGSVSGSGMMDSYGVKERLQPCNVSDRRSGASNSSQIEFRLSATVPSGSSISTSNHVRIESEGKCSCSICNKTFSKPSQLRLHVNIHYFERPFRCESCAVSFRTKGHLQKHKRSVSHYNKVNMNMTFGTPTTDNPRPFKCGDCKIAFRIHGHLAKHLRSKMHIMKLECLGKLPFGMYAEMERSGVNLNEIDTTDCENSLESLQSMAHRLYQQDPRRMRWHTADGQAPPLPQTHGNTIHQVVRENEGAIRETQNVKLTTPVQYSLSPSLPAGISPENNVIAAPLRRSSIISSPVQVTTTLSPLNCSSPHFSRITSSKAPPSTVTSANHVVKREPEESICNVKSPASSTMAPVSHFGEAVNCANSVVSGIEEYVQPKVNVTVESNVPFLHRSCTCHLCSRVFKSAKFLQVHLYCDHQQQQNQQPSTAGQWPSPHPTTTSNMNSTVPEANPKAQGKDIGRQWLDCDRTITNGIIADSFSCDICRKQFPTQITLQQHLLTHAQLRPFVCDTCDAGFTSSVMLATHLATHQQDKNFMCNECGKSFAILVDFQRHVQAHLNDATCS